MAATLEETAAWVASLGENEIGVLLKHARGLEKDVYEVLADWYSMHQKKNTEDSPMAYEDVRLLIVALTGVLAGVDTTGARVSLALEDIEDRARRGAQRHNRDITRGRVLEGTNPFVTSVVRARQEAYVDKLIDDTRTQMLGTITRAVSTRETPKGLLRRLARAGKKAKDSAKLAARGMFRRFYSAIVRLIKTEAVHAYNAHVDYIGDQIQRRDKKVKKRWEALLDMKTCSICRALDGETAKPNQPFKNGLYAPPVHPHCRCFLTLVY